MIAILKYAAMIVAFSKCPVLGGPTNVKPDCKAALSANGVGPTMKAARDKAIASWRIKVRRFYGFKYSDWSNAKSKLFQYSLTGEGVVVDVRARPCNRAR